MRVVERRRPRVLVVDPDAGDRARLGGALERLYELSFAGDAVQAVRLARLADPDLLLIDYALPGGSASLVVERLRAIPELADLPVILVSGWDADWSWNDLLEMEAAAFVPKPVERDGLVEEIERALAAA